MSCVSVCAMRSIGRGLLWSDVVKFESACEHRQECALDDACLTLLASPCRPAPPRLCAAGEDGPKRALQLWRFMYYDCKWIRSLEDAAVERGAQNGFSPAFR